MYTYYFLPPRIYMFLHFALYIMGLVYFPPKLLLPGRYFSMNKTLKTTERQSNDKVWPHDKRELSEYKCGDIVLLVVL